MTILEQLPLDIKEILNSIDLSSGSRHSLNEISPKYKEDYFLRYVEINHICPNIMGFSSGDLEFCPDNTQPSIIEILSLYWVLRPDLGVAIASLIPLDDAKGFELKTIIADYVLGEKWRGYS